MKNQALISLKDISKKLKCRLLQFLFGALGLRSPAFQNLQACIHAVKGQSLLPEF